MFRLKFVGIYDINLLFKNILTSALRLQYLLNKYNLSTIIHFMASWNTVCKSQNVCNVHELFHSNIIFLLNGSPYIY